MSTAWGLVALVLVVWMLGAAYGWYLRSRHAEKRGDAA